MKKYKLLRFGHCYTSRNGEFVVALLKGDKKHGYLFVGSHVKPCVILGKFQLLSRVVPNDDSWIEISADTFNVASELHISGYIVKPSEYRGGLPVISKRY